jgi:hypothetical protein
LRRSVAAVKKRSASATRLCECWPTTAQFPDAGKNPVSHVGKLYSLAAARIALAIVRDNVLIHHRAITLVSQMT